jgi:glucose/arabinose dehydrogenase
MNAYLPRLFGTITWRGFFVVVTVLAALLVAPAATLTAQDAAEDPGGAVTFTVEKLVTANYAVSLAFAPDGRLFYTEKATGNVRVIQADGTAQLEPVIHLDTDALVERGLLGIALDPHYEENGMIWVIHTAPGTARDWPENRVVRFHEENGVGSDPETMLAAPITTGELKHNGGNLHFDADGLLYLSFGDFGDATNAQNLDALPGKIHRFAVTDEGLVAAEGNPFPDNSTYAYGLRNSFDFTFDPFGDGQVLATENGFQCDDEVNLILPGRNYGWGPDYLDNCYGTTPLDVPDYMPPLLSYTPTIAPTGIVVYDNPAVPAWEGQVFFCAWNTGKMQRVILNAERTAVEAVYPVDLAGVFCRTDVVIGPEGALYFLDPIGIYRLTPES